mmetsp:Transcript_23199/g.45139  ORF Transcript_23199/g.45139 Transcript_23199/m.45139 type:complete len:417 (+) Transcript_23199:537-1787(+)
MDLDKAECPQEHSHRRLPPQRIHSRGNGESVRTLSTRARKSRLQTFARHYGRAPLVPPAHEEVRSGHSALRICGLANHDGLGARDAAAPPVGVAASEDGDLSEVVGLLEEGRILQRGVFGGGIPGLALGSLRLARAPSKVVGTVVRRQQMREVGKRRHNLLRHLLGRQFDARLSARRDELAAHRRQNCLLPVLPVVEARLVVDGGVVRRCEEDLLPRRALRARDLWLVVNQDVAAHCSLVSGHNHAAGPGLSEVLDDPLVLLRGAKGRGEHGRRAEEDLVALGHHLVHRLDGAVARRQPGEEALGVKERLGRLHEFGGDAFLHRVVLGAVDRRGVAPRAHEALVPVDDDAVHVEQDDRRRHLQEAEAVLGHHRAVRERGVGVLLCGEPHLQPLALAVGARHAELLERVGKRLLLRG